MSKENELKNNIELLYGGVNQFNIRVEVDYTSILLGKEEEPRRMYLNDLELEFLSNWYNHLCDLGVSISDDINKKLKYLLYEERLVRAYNNIKKGGLPPEKSVFDHIASLRDKALCEEVILDEETCMMFDAVETEYIINGYFGTSKRFNGISYTLNCDDMIFNDIKPYVWSYKLENLKEYLKNNYSSMFAFAQVVILLGNNAQFDKVLEYIMCTTPKFEIARLIDAIANYSKCGTEFFKFFINFYQISLDEETKESLAKLEKMNWTYELESYDKSIDTENGIGNSDTDEEKDNEDKEENQDTEKEKSYFELFDSNVEGYKSFSKFLVSDEDGYYVYAIFPYKEVPILVNNYSYRKVLLDLVKSHYQDKMISGLSNIKNNKEYKYLINACKKHNIIVITGQKKDGDVKVDFHCPSEPINPFQQRALSNLDEDISLYMEFCPVKPGVIEFIEEIREKKREEDIKLYSKVHKTN